MNLITENLSMTYGKKRALHNFSYEFNSGVYGLIGPNGAGKTTLMHVLAGVFPASAGTIMLNERICNTRSSEYAEYIGYLPQDSIVYDNFTVKEFLRYCAIIKKINIKKDKEKINELLDVVSLKNQQNVKCKKLSGGMKRRLGIAQALLNNPSILILDEPTTGVDIMERIKFRNLISSLAQDRIVIYSTHTVSDIEMVAKDIILLMDGQIVKQGCGVDLLLDLEHKVWECEISTKEYEEYVIEYGNEHISNIYLYQAGFRLRLLSIKKPFKDAINVAPTYEDLSIYTFLGREL